MAEVKSDLVFRNRISLRNFIGTYILLGLIAVIIWIAGYLLRDRIPIYISIIAGLLPLIYGLIHTWLVRISTEYRVFEDSLEVESGIISRTIDNIQLFRVRDLGLQQSILGRILNVGNIAVSSTDQSNPHLILRGLDDPRLVYDKLRELVAKGQATRRTMIVEDDVEHEQFSGN